MLIVFPVKLSFDIGHESLRQGLNGRVHKESSMCAHEAGICVCIQGNRPHAQGNRIGV
jgi:hypothetical protein